MSKNSNTQLFKFKLKINLFRFNFNLLINLLIISASLKYSECSADTNVQWNWYCNQDRQCIRIDPIKASTVTNPVFSSYSLCHLICDKYASLWPKPTNVHFLSKKYVEINPNNIEFDLKTPDKPTNFYLTKVTDLFMDDVREKCDEKCILPNRRVLVDVRVTDTDVSLNLDTKENYLLNISSKNDNADTIDILIEAPTVFGARHAVQTLAQLMVIDFPSPTIDNPNPRGLNMIIGAAIADKPFYPHRGLLLDSSRNYLSLDTIKRHIQAMGMNKLNVLHWHITDSQSFPFVSNSVPEMNDYGAYSKSQIYTSEDLTHLMHYARLRGVRILLELDGPAHAGNGWQWGPEANLGNLALCVNEPDWRKSCGQPPCGQLNPINKNVYAVLGKLYRDMMEAVEWEDGGMFHMGGDEVFFPCWNNTQEVVNYLHDHGRGTNLEDFLFLWGEFQRQASMAFDDQAKHNRTKFIMWSSALTEIDVILKYLHKDRYIIQTWVASNDTLPTNLLNLGYKLIMSTKNAWYLDHGFWGSNKYYSWRVVYDNRLPDHANVLGGEVCMWGEYVDDNTVDGKVWPRAAAAAERLWTNSQSRRYISDENRFYRQRERLLDHGIKADAVAPRWCTQNDGGCQ